MITATAIECFITRASCVISLYCGVKLPKNQRKSAIKIHSKESLDDLQLEDSIKVFLMDYLQNYLQEYEVDTIASFTEIQYLGSVVWFIVPSNSNMYPSLNNAVFL